MVNATANGSAINMRLSSVIGNGLRWISPRAADMARTVWTLIKGVPWKPQNAPWNKADIINYLAETRGYRHYLELCTPTSGGRYSEIDRSKFATCVRLMYQCPENHLPSDRLEIDFRTTGLDISECLSRLRATGQCVDIVLIDSFHDYEPSLRDLIECFRLIREGGTLVVHDCLPPRAEIAQPNFIPGEWCGVTYQAFLDFVSTRDDLEYYTVDTDYGCGIIHKHSSTSASAGLSSIKQTAADKRTHALATWQTKRDDSCKAFAFFDEHKRTLMESISIRKFLSKNRKPRRALWQ